MKSPVKEYTKALDGSVTRKTFSVRTRMPVSMLVKTYSSHTKAALRELIERFAAGTPYAGEGEALLYRMCDELLKNAIKANYQFLLLWLEARKRLTRGEQGMSRAHADEWLSAIFFSGEDILLEKQLEKIPDFAQLQTRVRRILDLENALLKERDRGGPESRPVGNSAELYAEYRPLVQLKKLAKELKIRAKLMIDKNAEQLIFRVENDAPIREKDVNRIREVRAQFREYHDRGEPHMFFVEHMDTSGGGHGLGFALMDSVLLDLQLPPEKCLYLVPGGRTMVLLNLPL